MGADFSGYATKAGLKCTDGRTITPEAFAHQDKVKVPLVWQHDHSGPKNVLGHAILEARPDGMYCQGFFNSSEAGLEAKELVKHGDITALSIYANQLVEKLVNKAKSVMHGSIKEVSLVLSGANSGAFIDNVAVEHGDGEITELDEAIIFTGLNFEHSSADNEEGDKGVSSDDEVTDDGETVEHAEGDKSPQEVYDSLDADQKQLVHYMIGEALSADTTSADDSAQHSDDSGDATEDDGDQADKLNDNDEGDLTHQEGSTDMTRNVFDSNDGTPAGDIKALTHSDLTALVTSAKKGTGHFKDAVLAHADEYGITDIDMLFPDAKALTQTPEFISRRMEWVSVVLGGTKHSPFAKVKSMFADITEPEARAKGYIKGTRKKEEVFKLLKRTTGPATIYKKQKLDRDDILDIVDLDVVAWLKGEMRIMIEEEIARAILVGDGRSSMDEDKVKDPEGAIDGVGIRSILHDDDLYALKAELPANVSAKDSVKAIIRASDDYRGSGTPTMFMSRKEITELLLDEDKFGRPLYANKAALADKLGVGQIVPVDVFTEYPGLYAIVVSLSDYTVGSNRGGELTSFEDFDIDFNQNKYLQETRLSGGLTKPFSAIVITKVQGTLAVAEAPSFNGTTNTVTVPTVDGVVYTIDGEPVTGDRVISEPTEVRAEPADGHYLATGTTRDWTYTP